MNRDDHERAIFEQALNLPGDLEPYDLSQPFDSDTLMAGFTELPERIIHAEEDPVLDQLAACAREAWAAFLATNDGPEREPRETS